MNHLGDRLISLVDGELDHGARDRVLAHLAVCQQCRTEAEEQRRLKSMVADLDDPEPSTDLVYRLRSLAEPGEPMPPAPPSWPDASAGTQAGHRAGFHGSTSRRGRASSHPGIRKASFAVAGMFCLATAAATTAFVVGDDGTADVRVTPPADRYAVEHAVTVPSVPLTDPAAGPAATGVSLQPHP